MTFQQLNYFLAVAKCGSFTLAADELFISQSSLSKQMKALECELGITLISRKSYPVTLTPAGKHFLKLALELTKGYKDMLFQMSQFAAFQNDCLRVGSIPVLSHYGLIPQIIRFQAEHPQIRLALHEDDQQRIWGMFQENLLDFAIVRVDLLSCENLDVIPLLSEEIVLVCPAGHRLNTLGEVSISQLREERFVLMDEKSGIHHLCKAVCQNNGFDPFVFCTSTHHKTLLDMIGEGLGISLIPKNLVTPDIYPQLACIPLSENIQSTTALVKKAAQNAPPEVSAFYEFFRAKSKGL